MCHFKQKCSCACIVIKIACFAYLLCSKVMSHHVLRCYSSDKRTVSALMEEGSLLADQPSGTKARCRVVRSAIADTISNAWSSRFVHLMRRSNRKGISRAKPYREGLMGEKISLEWAWSHFRPRTKNLPVFVVPFQPFFSVAHTGKKPARLVSWTLF